MINHRFPVPFIVLSGDVVDASASDLRFGDLLDRAGTVSVGLYDADSKFIATGSGNARKFFIGYSSEHNRDAIDVFKFGAQLPKGSPYWDFKGEDVISFEYSDPTKVSNEKWVAGWSGANGCDLKLPKFECGKVYGLRVRVEGNEAYKQWAGPLVREFYSDPICCGDSTCSDGCDDQNVDCEIVMKDIAKKINSDKYAVESLGLHARYTSNKYVAPVVNMHIYKIIVTDNGDATSLSLVQKTVPKPFKVERTQRIGLQSVYEVCADALPEDLVPDAVVNLGEDCADCPTCPQGSTVIDPVDVYTVVRPISEDTVLATEADQLAFATTVAGEYGGTNPVFLSFNTAGAVIEFSLPVGTVAPDAVKADVILKSRTTTTSCVLPSVGPIAWAETCDSYRVQRTLCITLRRTNCPEGDRLAELQDYYANFPSVVPGSIVKVVSEDPESCEDSYQISQYSDCMEDGCVAEDIAVFQDLGAYENQLWKEVEEVISYDETKKCGLELSVKVPQKFIDDCEYELGDDTILQPLTMEVTWVYDGYTEFPDNCSMSLDNVKRVQSASISRQSGTAVLHQYIKSGAYEVFAEDYKSPRMRRLFDAARRKQVDRSVDYRLYYIQFKVSRHQHNFDQQAEVAEAVVCIPMNRPDKMVKFERAFLSPLSKYGVTLKKREDGKA